MRNKRGTGCSTLLIANKISSRCAVMCYDVKGTHYLNCHLLGCCSPLPPHLYLFFYSLICLSWHILSLLVLVWWVWQCSAKDWRTYYSLTFERFLYFSRSFQWCSAACNRLLSVCSVSKCCVRWGVASSYHTANVLHGCFNIDLCVWTPTYRYAVLWFGLWYEWRLVSCLELSLQHLI
jgi:hypothetical protein